MGSNKSEIYKYSISESAYITSILHTAKHVTNAVNGLLLGHKSDRSITITHTLPLAHSTPTIYTSPLLELGLIQANILAESRGLTLVGYYHANEVASDDEVGIVPCRVADAIWRECEGACLLMLDPRRLVKEKRRDVGAWVVHGSRGKGWRRMEASLEVGKVVLEKCADCLEDMKVVQKVVDFEEHCQNPDKDWMDNKFNDP
eukprot:Plantae.Rhodophyta-Hildenbrandia_rubra.ctg6261.p1 GENE.Plantae.Rhodophyta-Hildenbrandia_rubra.ctg6261~~Plantae.Rhodophyta-Hildenbrandia_rubra.ctg6261.p1  ORF type:complete len:202 (-),score=33.92 Plantae.Rhodophyta-Hildenbrandia_rubra.ctg6261:605-1210(-)